MEEVELRDGSRLAVRPVEAGDKPLFERVGEARVVTKGGTTWEIDVALHVAP